MSNQELGAEAPYFQDARKCMVYDRHYMVQLASIGAAGNMALNTVVDTGAMIPCDPYCPGVEYTDRQVIEGLLRRRAKITEASCPYTGITVTISKEKQA